MKVTALLSFAFLSTPVWSGLVSAQWPSDPAVNVPVCTAPGTQLHQEPRPVSDGSGGAIIVWHDNSDSSPGIYAQRVDRWGILRWQLNGVCVTRSSIDWNRPRAATDASGGVIVVWSDLRNDESDIYAQRINGSGSFVWSHEGVPVCEAPGYQYYPEAISDGSGGAFVIWIAMLGDSPPFFEVRAQRIDSCGTTYWKPDGVAVSPPLDLFPLSHGLVSDQGGGAIVGWEEDRGPECLWEVYVQRVDSAGRLVWGSTGIAVCTLGHIQYNVHMVSDDSGGAVVAWQHQRTDAWPEVRMQRVSSSGELRWSPSGVPVFSLDRNVFLADLVPDGSAGAVVAYYFRSDSDPGICTYLQRVDPSGNTLWEPGGAAVCTTCCGPCRITHDASRGLLATWSTEDHAGSPEGDIYAQRINESGQIQWKPKGAIVCAADDAQTAPCIVSDFAGGAIIAWHDNRNREVTGWDIYAQNIHSDGSLGTESRSVVTGGGWIGERVESRETKRAFGFNAHTELGAVWGQLQFKDHDTGIEVHSDTILGLAVYGDTCAEFSGSCGIGRTKGYTFDCTVEDRGEPGRGRDRFSLDVWDTNGNLYYSASGVLGGGNIQIHTVEDEISANLGEVTEGIRAPELGHRSSIQLGDAVHHSRFDLIQNSPNPFRTKTTIYYSLPKTSHVTLTIYDITGRLVKTLVNETQQPGIRPFNWNRKDNPSGVYFYRLSVGEFVETRKMVVVE